MNDFLEVALPAFRWLLDGDRYRLAQQRISPSFGNGLLVFQSDALCIKVVRDRGQLFVDFASASRAKPQWYDFDVVRRFLDGSTQYEPGPSGAFSSAVSFDAETLAASLERYVSEAEAAFAAQRLQVTETSLDRLERERAQRIFR